MFIEDESALKVWLIATLEPLCDAEPDALARYVLALVKKDKPLDKLRENCIDRLEVFLCQETASFVDRLFDVICNRRYLSEGKKENVEPTKTEPDNHESLNYQDESVVEEKSDPIESHPIPTTTGSRFQSLQRNNSNHDSKNLSDTRNSSNKRHLKATSPPAKRTHRSYSDSSDSSSSPHPSSSARPSNSSERKAVPCIDSAELSAISQNDSSYRDRNALSSSHDPERVNYFTFDPLSNETDQQYNPEEPEFDYNIPKPALMRHQRTLVTVVTNPDPSSNGLNGRHRDSNMRNGSQRIVRTKRHVTTKSGDHREPPNYDENRARKRPWQKSNVSTGNSTTLEIRKIPTEFNTISKLNEHFSKFGTVTNVQIAYDGAPDSALVAYGTFAEAETAYKNPEPLFNNRFIKIFWHKGSNTTIAEARPAKHVLPLAPVPHPAKLHWPKLSKPITNPTATIKKKIIAPVGSSSIKKEAAKKAAIEIRRKTTGLLEKHIQQQKVFLKKLEGAETPEERDAIRALMKQADATITALKDSLRETAVKTPTPQKLSEQDLLKHREEILKKKIETLRAKTSAGMRRAMTNTLQPTLEKENNEQKEISSNNEDSLLGNDEKIDAPKPNVEEIPLAES